MPASFQRRKKVGYRKKSSSWGRMGRQVGGTVALARKAWSGMKYLKSLINVERKFFDSVVDTFVPTAAGQVFNLSSIAEGNDYNQRDGNSILLQSMLFRGTISGPTTSPAGDIVRVVIFQDNDQRGVDPVTADLFEDTTNGLRLSNSPLLHTVNKRFNILLDKRIPVGGYQVTATQAVSTGTDWWKTIKRYQKFKDSHIKFAGTSGADAGQYEGCMYIYVQTVLALGSISWNCRLRYTDN